MVVVNVNRETQTITLFQSVFSTAKNDELALRRFSIILNTIKTGRLSLLAFFKILEEFSVLLDIFLICLISFKLSSFSIIRCR